jgi:membrane associated rhomboid family serine protease
MLVFAIMAESLLRLLDVYRFLTVLLLSAFCASSVSLYLAPYEFVIGASGGVFGLFGAFCVVKFTKDLPGTVSLRSNKMVLLVIVIQVVSGYFIDGVDYFSHGGGFVLGAVIMALYLYFAPTPSIFQSTRVEKALAVMLSSFYFWGLGMFLFQVNA